MQYTLTEEEKEMINREIDVFLEDREDVDFTGTTISPYNLREVLLARGFEEDYNDCNAMDSWWYLKKEGFGRAVVYFSALSFDLKLTYLGDD